MIRNMKVPELVALNAPSPFKRKKAISGIEDFGNDQNAWVAQNGQFFGKAILGKNARPHKTFGKVDIDQTMKSCLKKKEGRALQEISNQIQTIDVDDLPKANENAQTSIKQIYRNPVFNLCQNRQPLIDKRIVYKRFFSQELAFDRTQKQKCYSKSSNDSKKKKTVKLQTKSKKNNRSISQNQPYQSNKSGVNNLTDLPKNYPTVQQYLNNNFINLKPSIQSKLVGNSYLRKKLENRKRNLNSRI